PPPSARLTEMHRTAAGRTRLTNTDARASRERPPARASAVPPEHRRSAPRASPDYIRNRPNIPTRSAPFAAPRWPDGCEDSSARLGRQPVARQREARERPPAPLPDHESRAAAAPPDAHRRAG